MREEGGGRENLMLNNTTVGCSCVLEGLLSPPRYVYEEKVAVRCDAEA